MRRWFPRRPSAPEPSAASSQTVGTLPEWADDGVTELRVDGSAATTDALLGWLHKWPTAPPNDADFLLWSAEPSPGESHILSRFLLALWRSRPDLRVAFPGVPVDATAQLAFREWAIARLPLEMPDLPSALRPQGGPVSREVPGVAMPHLTSTVLVVGYLRAVLGLGDAGRRLAHLLTRVGEAVKCLSFDYIEAPIRVPWATSDLDESIDPDIVFLAVNAAEAPMIRGSLPSRDLGARYVIGLWFWELEELSPAMAAGFAAVDEVWVTSEFTASAVQRAAPAGFPVHVLPLGADLRPAPPRTPQTRARFGLPTTATVVGNVFDYASRIERKNPVGLIEAWKRAFPTPDRNARVLFFKTLNAASHLDSGAIVEAAADGRDDIIIRDERLSSADRDLLVPQFDAVASLHRAEGYGLTLLEAMHHGLPVIASDYSGNLAFMTPDNSWLVPCRPATVDHDSLVSYPKGGLWAEPDIDAAALTIRDVVENIDSSSIRERTQRGQENVRALIDGFDGAAWIADRLATIRRDRNAQR